MIKLVILVLLLFVSLFVNGQYDNMMMDMPTELYYSSVPGSTFALDQAKAMMKPQTTTTTTNTVKNNAVKNNVQTPVQPPMPRFSQLKAKGRVPKNVIKRLQNIKSRLLKKQAKQRRRSSQKSSKKMRFQSVRKTAQANHGVNCDALRGAPKIRCLVTEIRAIQLKSNIGRPMFQAEVNLLKALDK